MSNEVDRVLERLAIAYGPDEAVRLRLRPLAQRILETCPPSAGRTELLSLLGEMYEMQVRVKGIQALLRRSIRYHRNRLYAAELGIEPPNLAA